MFGVHVASWGDRGSCGGGALGVPLKVRNNPLAKLRI